LTLHFRYFKFCPFEVMAKHLFSLLDFKIRFFFLGSLLYSYFIFTELFGNLFFKLLPNFAFFDIFLDQFISFLIFSFAFAVSLQITFVSVFELAINHFDNFAFEIYDGWPSFSCSFKINRCSLLTLESEVDKVVIKNIALRFFLWWLLFFFLHNYNFCRLF